MWPPSALRSSSRLRRCWPALRQARSLRSNSLAPRLASARCSLANQYRSIFLSGRCVRSKIGAPPSPRPSLLRIPAVFDCVRSRTRSRWARPRYPVRCSRLDTSRLLARADDVLVAHVAGPFSRCPSFGHAPGGSGHLGLALCTSMCGSWLLGAAQRSARAPFARCAPVSDRPNDMRRPVAELGCM